VLLGVGTRQAAALIGHIDALLDLDNERAPGSQRWDFMTKYLDSR
jgi:hypothetical protein